MSLLRNLLSPRGKADKRGFMDTQPDTTHASSAWSNTLPHSQPGGGWAESAIDLALGTEVQEFPGDSAADLMDEFFAKSEKRST